MTNTSDPNMERKLHYALHVLGRLIPTSPDQVERAEREADTERLPEQLVDPDRLLQRLKSDNLQTRVSGSPSNGGASRNLARAARDGKSIPADVEERMKADRHRAEEERSQRRNDDDNTGRTQG